MTLDKYIQNKPFLLHRYTGKYDQHGFRVFSLQLISDGKIVDQLQTISGAPTAQKRDLVSPEKDFSKSGNPIPEGIYKIGQIIRMAASERGVGFVKIPIDVLPDFRVNNRGEFLLHLDENRSSGALGSLGCIVTRTISEMDRIVGWCEQKARPTVLVCDYGKGLLSKRGVVINLQASAPAAQPSTKQKMNQAGLELLKNAEGFRTTAYPDPGTGGDPWTIGFGSTKGVKPGMKITQIEAEEMLRRDLAEFEKDVSNLVKVPLNDNQFSALVSFAYNCGSDIDQDSVAEGLGDSTLLKLLNAGDYKAAAEQFTRWDKGGGKVLEGLTRRRKAEQALFLS